MASEDVIKSLWEIANSNSEESIKLEEFANELNNSVDEKIKIASNNSEIMNLSEERARALVIILNQAKVNPKSFGNFQGNKFIVSNEIIAKAVKTMKYENRFIQGTTEYEERITGEKNVKTEGIILTIALVDKMLNNYSDLSSNDKDGLWGNYKYLSPDAKKKLYENQQKELDTLIKKLSETGKTEEAKKLQKVKDEQKKFYEMSPEEQEQFIKDDEEFQEKFYSDPKNRGKKPTPDDYKSYLGQINNRSIENTKIQLEAEDNKLEEELQKKLENLINELNAAGKNEEAENVSAQYKEFQKEFYKDSENKGKILTIEEFIHYLGTRGNNKIEEFYNQSRGKAMAEDKEFLKEFYSNPQNKGKEPTIDNYSNYLKIKFLDNLTFIPQGDLGDSLTAKDSFYRKKEFTVDRQKSEGVNLQINDEVLGEFFVQEEVIEDNFKLSSNVQSELNQLPIALAKAGFSQEEIKEALNQYKELLSEVPKESLTSEDIIDTLYDNADSKKMSERTEEILGIIIPLNYNDSLNDMLLNHREEFLQEIENSINRDINLEQEIQLDGELESALNEYFQENQVEMDVSATVDLQVEDATQVKEEGSQTTEFDSSYIEETDIKTMHLKDGVPMQVDTVFERLCDEALQEGAVLDNDAYEKLLQEYMNEQGLKKVGVKSNAPETKGEKAGEDNEHANSELPPIFENQNNLDETIVDSDVPKDSISEFTEFEEYADEDGNTKKVAGLKKDEKGDITDVTVFNPLDFVKISGVTTTELQEQVDMVKTLTQERTAVTEKKNDEHEDVIE